MCTVYPASNAVIYLVDPSCSASPTSKLTTVACQPIQATVVSLRLVSSCQRYRCAVQEHSMPVSSVVSEKPHQSLLSDEERWGGETFAVEPDCIPLPSKHRSLGAMSLLVLTYWPDTGHTPTGSSVHCFEADRDHVTCSLKLENTAEASFFFYKINLQCS